ncbi:MAG TPA: amino acid ABC transporter permease [Acholeplasmataceae bacterium]|nr:amino acid ABC transporter permease [Acholeplasmataceae bacterium]
MTLALAVFGTFFGLIIALIFSILRVQKPLETDRKFVKILKLIGFGFVKTYVTIFRGTPMIVQGVIFYYSFYSIGIRWSPFNAGLFTVSLNTAAYLTEVLRGGIQSVDPGQEEAARSIGMSGGKAFLYIIFPQAIKNSFASIGNELIVNIKDTAVLSTIMVVDLFYVANSAAGTYFLFVEAMLVAAMIYLALTYSSSKILQIIEKKLNIPTKDIVSSN